MHPTSNGSTKDESLGWYCAHCQRGVCSTEVTYRERHTECGRVITNDRPPAPAVAQPSRLTREDLIEIRALLNESKPNKSVLSCTEAEHEEAVVRALGKLDAHLAGQEGA